jgi:hypothetical protein
MRDYILIVMWLLLSMAPAVMLIALPLIYGR